MYLHNNKESILLCIIFLYATDNGQQQNKDAVNEPPAYCGVDLVTGFFLNGTNSFYYKRSHCQQRVGLSYDIGNFEKNTTASFTLILKARDIKKCYIK